MKGAENMTIVNMRKIRWYVLNIALFLVMFWFFIKCGEAYRTAPPGNGIGVFLRNLRIAVSSPMSAFNLTVMAFGLFAAALFSIIIHVISRTLAKKRGSSIIINQAWITGIITVVVAVSINSASLISNYFENQETSGALTQVLNSPAITSVPQNQMEPESTLEQTPAAAELYAPAPTPNFVNALFYSESRVDTRSILSGFDDGYIDENDDCIVISTDHYHNHVEYWLIDYPITIPYPAGRDRGYIPKSSIVRGSITPFFSTVLWDTTVYRASNLQTVLGSISSNDSLIVLAENGTTVQIMYSPDTASSRIGWINKSS